MPPIHPAPAVLRSFRDGRLPPAEAAAVERHLAGDPGGGECRACLASLAGMSQDDLVDLIGDQLHKMPTTDHVVAAGGSNAGVIPSALAAWMDAHYQPGWRAADAGTFGTVFRARHALLGGAERAVKWIPGPAPPHAARYDDYGRVLKELRTAGELDHDHIVKVFDADRVADGYVLVMEWLDGANFETWAAAGVPTGRACEAARQAALGLHHAHTRPARFVHRDVKPKNLILTRQGVVKVIDFGIAKALADTGPGTAPDVNPGTPLYMAPEQFRAGGRVDHRADIYALGCTLYYLLTGTPPYAGGRAEAVLYQHAHASVPDVRAARPDVPPGVAAVLARMMAKAPDARPATADEVARGLEPYCTPLAPDVPSPPAPSGRRGWRSFAAGAVLLTAVGGAGMWAVSLRSNLSPAPAAATRVGHAPRATPAGPTSDDLPLGPLPVTPTPPAPAATDRLPELLFNGTSLAGWQAIPTHTAKWTVADGKLTCAEGGYGLLVSTRADLANFRLRARVTLNRGGEGSIYVRAGHPREGISGYKVHLVNPDPGQALAFPGAALGSLIRYDGRLVVSGGTPLAVGETFGVEVVARGSMIRVWVDDRLTGRIDDAVLIQNGHVVLGHATAQTAITFSGIEITNDYQ